MSGRSESGSNSMNDEDSSSHFSSRQVTYSTDECDTDYDDYEYRIETGEQIEMGGTAWVVDKELGEGTYGVVYKCSQTPTKRDFNLPQTIAIKVILSQISKHHSLASPTFPDEWRRH